MRCKDDEKQQSIKRAVIKLILTDGFHGVSISKIAQEARVSPATVYVYYSNKEAMLYDIYRECGERTYTYILSRVDCERGGDRFIESIVKAYYSYIVEFGEEFYFVEQFSSCPALVGKCGGLEGNIRITLLFDELKRQRFIKDVNNHIIASILFNPVKSVAIKYGRQDKEAMTVLAELITIIQDALVIK